MYNLTLLIAFTNCNKMGTTWGEKNVVLQINATIFFWKTFKSTQWILNHWFTCISPFSSGPHGWGVSPSADFNGWLEQLSNTSNTYKVSPCVGPLWGSDLNNNFISSKTSDHHQIRLDCGRSSNPTVGFSNFWLRGADDEPCFSLCYLLQCMAEKSTCLKSRLY